VTDVDVLQFSAAVAGAADADDRIRALEGALGLWTGPALEEFVGEEWADGEIARLTELHAGTVDDYAEELISARRSADAVALLEAQIARHPYRDSSRGLLIRALASAGRQADALRAFQQYRSLLIDELGTELPPMSCASSGGSPRSGTGSMPIPACTRRSTLSRSLSRARWRTRPGSSAAPTRWTRSPRNSRWFDVRDCGAWCSEASRASARRPCWRRSRNWWCRRPDATVVYGRCDETGVPLQPFRSVLADWVERAPVDLLANHVAAAVASSRGSAHSSRRE
jgi:hypothetical protein